MHKKINIYDLEVEYDVDYRDIRYPRLEFRTGNLLLVLPKNTKDHKEVIDKHKNWIYRKNSEIISSLKESKDKKLVMDRTAEEFKEIVKNKVNLFLLECDLNINGVNFRNMSSKWASCSSQKNLTINTLLKYLPDRLIDYVVYHEVMHLKERKHNEKFWGIVNKKFCDHQKIEKELFLYWFLVQDLIKNSGKPPANLYIPILFPCS
ncbi:M48 family metallopeptidase [Candidatus Woesearchaeota archaeon]|nr:M48 family metallopeptidase [Candidatus Woesearchaeota archaeon]